MINDFRGNYFFLSNYYSCKVTYNGVTYQNTEAAFQAQKSTDKNVQRSFSSLTPNEAKRRGRNVNLRKDWEDVKTQLMYEVCKAKFTQNTTLKEKLLSTENQELVEGNTWGDTIWGMVDGEGENRLGKILMQIRSELSSYTFDAYKTKEDIIAWIKDYFKSNGTDKTKAVIGISGGKDSSICAKLLVEALGADRVVGVMMPQHIQEDIDVSKRVCDLLGIKSITINIGNTVDSLYKELKDNSVNFNNVLTFNTPARVRMATLYAIAASVGGRVCNTCNYSEDYVGYATKFGDAAGDFSILSDLTVTEVLAVGDALGLPNDIVHKTPIDGLCGKSDEDSLGFKYSELDKYLREGKDALKDNPALIDKIEKMHKASMHKLLPMPRFELN